MAVEIGVLDGAGFWIKLALGEKNNYRKLQ